MTVKTWKDIRKEEKTVFGIRTRDGFELLSNDEEMKYIVRKVACYDGSMEQECFCATCFVRESDGWVRASEEQTFTDERELLKAFGMSDEFTKACSDLRFDE